MHVQMKYFLTAIAIAVDQQAITILGHTLVLGDFGSHGEQVTNQLFVISRQIVDRWNLFIGYDQYVDWRLGLNVLKRRYLVILIDNVCRNFTLNNFGKDRGHELSSLAGQLVCSEPIGWLNGSFFFELHAH
jgi:hypothetical protein